MVLKLPKIENPSGCNILGFSSPEFSPDPPKTPLLRGVSQEPWKAAVIRLDHQGEREHST